MGCLDNVSLLIKYIYLQHTNSCLISNSRPAALFVRTSHDTLLNNELASPATTRLYKLQYLKRTSYPHNTSKPSTRVNLNQPPLPRPLHPQPLPHIPTQHIIIPNLRPSQIHPRRQRLHPDGPQIHRQHRHHFPVPQRILALHPDVRAALAAEVAVDGFDARGVVA